MFKRLSLLAIIAASFLLLAVSINAKNNCQVLYGGGINCQVKGNLELDKKVQRPGTTEYLDNLSTSENYYSSIVNFQISVTNTGKKAINEIEIVDQLPPSFTLASGPGNFDKAKNTLTFKILNLEGGETKITSISLKIDKTNDNITCYVNFAEAKARGSVSDDNSRFCVGQLANAAPTPQQTKGGFPVVTSPNIKQTPATGPEMLSLLGLIPLAVAGLFLRRRSK